MDYLDLGTAIMRVYAEEVMNMSEFVCSSGHLIAPSQWIKGKCPICGARCTTMDGHTEAELKSQEYLKRKEDEDG